MKALFVALTLLPALALADDSGDGVARVKAGAAPVVAVTVYPDGALISRTAHASMPAGQSVLVFEGLTANLDEGSLRAKSAASGVKVTGISADWEGHVDPPREAEAKLTADLEKVQHDITAENDVQQSLNVRRAVLEQYRNLSREAVGESAGDAKPGSPDKAKWAAALAYLTKEESSISSDTRASQQRMEALNEKQNALNGELNKLRAGADRRTRKVEVEVEAEHATEATFNLDYAVNGAFWVPAYDARQGATELALTAFGTVTQGTGEDWKDVALTLSTAKPAEGAQVPRLGPAQLTGYARAKRPVQIVSYGKQKTKNLEGKEGGRDTWTSGRASIDDHGSSVVFRIEGKETLPADKRPHRVEIATLPLKSELSWETVPKIAPFVYLKSTVKNGGSFPLLAGEVNVFRNSGFVGTSHLEYIAQGEEFSVSLGADDDLRVARVIDEKVDTKPKLLGTTRTLAYGYSIELANYKDAPQTINLVENLPVTQRKEIKVTLREGTTKPDKQDDEGFLKWKVDLKPQETKTVYFGYTVEYPNDFQIGGL